MVKKPLDNLEKVSRKPWSYISGGTMGTLVSCYYGRTSKPEEKKRWVESETELLVFFLDTFRELPAKVQRIWSQNADKSLLAFSPTHAFLCKPGFTSFKEGWEENNTYTYSWVRDQWIIPQRNFLHMQILDVRMLDCLIDEVQKSVPQGYRAHFKNVFSTFSYSMAPAEAREYLLSQLSYENWIKRHHFLTHLSEEIDSALFRLLPFFPEYELQERLELLFENIEEIDKTLLKKLISMSKRLLDKMGRYQIFSAQDLRNIAKALLILVLGKTRSSIPFHHRITQCMQSNGLSYPAPILFADTNWVKNYFGFLLNPGTENLEFWRFDNCGSEGRPIASWKNYLNGKTQIEWGVYTSPHEYTAHPN
jgi:hypothetical protein